MTCPSCGAPISYPVVAQPGLVVTLSMLCRKCGQAVTATSAGDVSVTDAKPDPRPHLRVVPEPGEDG